MEIDEPAAAEENGDAHQVNFLTYWFWKRLQIDKLENLSVYRHGFDLLRASFGNVCFRIGQGRLRTADLLTKIGYFVENKYINSVSKAADLN